MARIVTLPALAIMAMAAALLASGPAQATLIATGSIGGAPAGVNYINFNDLPAGSAGGTSTNLPNSLTPGSVTVSFQSDAAAVTGSLFNIYAAPFFSGGDDLFFDSPPTTFGADPTQYLTSGSIFSFPGAGARITFSGLQQYVGLVWGSVDFYNTLQFFNGSTLVGTLTGSDVLAFPTGDQGANGTVYVNVNSTLPFDSILATSRQYAFEFDNLAYNTTQVVTSPVPEPPTLLLLGSAIMALGVFWRRRNRV
jgi:hypothetical protein